MSENDKKKQPRPKENRPPESGAVPQPPDIPSIQTKFMMQALSDEEFRYTLINADKLNSPTSEAWKNFNGKLVTLLGCSQAKADEIIKQIVLVKWKDVHGLELVLGRAPEPVWPAPGHAHHAPKSPGGVQPLDA